MDKHLDDQRASLISANPSPDEEFGIKSHHASRSLLQGIRSHMSALLFHLVVLAIYTAIIFRNHYTWDGQPYMRRLPTEISTIVPYIEDRTVSFNSTTFWWDEPDRPISIYEGPPTPETEANWEALMTTGLRIGLTAEENAELPTKAEVSWDDPTVFPASISVFHHLHCLLRLRRIAWGNPRPQNESDYINVKHTDHCIEDLRNALMCHADTTLLPLVWTKFANDGMPLEYEAVFNIQHTCRNWDRIMEWAAPRGEKIERLPHMPD
ncbi:hypothetical protein PVAG01_08716 [Phlyctema vagabunda]|uniref:Uncharacterized protein n=1 Tax=Phlyctema vagabunda TaxID=108571 RepID=A0ABR4PAN2_9HELO